MSFPNNNAVLFMKEQLSRLAFDCSIFIAPPTLAALLKKSDSIITGSVVPKSNYANIAPP